MALPDLFGIMRIHREICRFISMFRVWKWDMSGVVYHRLPDLPWSFFGTTNVCWSDVDPCCAWLNDQLVGLREKLQETIDVPMKYGIVLHFFP